MITFTRSDWRDYATNYDVLRKLAPYEKMLRSVAGEIPDQSRKMTILDAACGTGNLFDHIPERHTLYGFDQSEAMIERAREKQRLRASGRRVSYVQGSLDTGLPFIGSFFDAVVSVNTLYAVSLPEATLREFYRVLHDHGILVLVTFRKGNENGLILKEHCQSLHPDAYWMDMHAEPQREDALIREALRGEAPATKEQALMVARCNRHINEAAHFHFFEDEDLKDLLSRAGFLITGIDRVYAQQCLFVTATKEIIS